MLGVTMCLAHHACVPQIYCPRGKLLNTPPALHHKRVCLRPTIPSSRCHVSSSRGAIRAAHASAPALGQHAPGDETSPVPHFRTLLNKKLSLNPLATFSDWVSRQFQALDLGLAASRVDSLPASLGLAAASGAFVAAKCDAISIASRGVFSNPTALFLQDVLDPLPASIVALFLAVASAFVCLWQLRGWCGKMMKAVASAFVGLWQLRGWWAAQMLMANPRTSHPRATSSSSSSSSSSGTFEAGAPHPTWQGTLLGLGRLGCIMWAAQALAGHTSVASAAAAYALSLLLLGPIASTLTASIAPPISNAFSGILRSASSAAPQPASSQQQQQQQQQQGEGSPEQRAASTSASPSSQPSNPSLPPPSASVPLPVLALLGAEAVFLVLQLEQLPIAVVAACGLAVAGLIGATQHMPDMRQRLEPHRVAVGDLVTVHLSLALGNGIIIDTTHGRQPLCFRVGSAREDLGLQLEEEEEQPEPSTSSAESSSMAPDAELESSQGASNASFSASAPSTTDTTGQTSATAPSAVDTTERTSTTARSASDTTEQTSETAPSASDATEHTSATASLASDTTMQTSATAPSAIGTTEQTSATASSASDTTGQTSATAPSAIDTTERTSATALSAIDTTGQTSATARSASDTTEQTSATAPSAIGTTEQTSATARSASDTTKQTSATAPSAIGTTEQTSATAPSVTDTAERRRFMQLVPAADEALEGSLQGTRVSFSIFNPTYEEGGFVNPGLVWSQPRDEAKRKFGGLLPIPGQVFMYPIGGHKRPHDWVPVMVTGVDEQAVHLNANYSAEGTAAIVHVDVQSLYKQI